MANKLPKDLLDMYKAEFRHTDISIQELCDKYQIQTKQLPGYTKWKKLPKVIEPTEIQEQPTEIQQTAKEDTLAKIEEFKQLAVANALRFIKEDVQFAEVKEFKDMVAIVDGIEKSYRDSKDPQGTTINIAIQNLVERFKDDC